MPQLQGVTVELTPRHLFTNVDETATLQISMTNTGSESKLFLVEVIGLNPDWFAIFEPQVLLEPGQQQVVTTSISPPGISSSQAGTHHFGVQISSLNDPGRVIQQEAFLTIHPFYDFAVSELLPKPFVMVT